MTGANRGGVSRQLERLFRDGTLSGLGDSQLLERYRTRRDESAFEALVDLHGPMVLGLCRRMLRDPRDIEDAFQATFLVLVRKAPAIRDGNRLSSWLYGVAYRVARRARAQTLRRRGRETAVADLVVAARPGPSDEFEVGPVLDEELNGLPEKYRAPLILCYLRGQTHEQAAEQLRCPVGTVRSRLARGRDLLRKRLTRRGFAPTAMAAIVGAGSSLPARLLIEAVPTSLASATLKAAIGFGSAQTIPAGAIGASALVLAQGAITTMKIAQFQWIGLAFLATTLSAGGVVAVSYASGQKNSAAAPGPQQQAKVPNKPVVPAEISEERFQALEGKLDELLRRLKPQPPLPSLNELLGHSDPPAPTRSNPVEVKNVPPTRANLELRKNAVTTTKSIRELEVELKLALDALDHVEEMVRRAVVGPRQLAESRGKVLIIAAQLEGLDDDILDEIARLKLELSRKHAERDRAQEQIEVPKSVVARYKRMNERKPGMVASEDVAKAEAEYEVAVAQFQIANAEISEVKLRIEQLEQRHDRIKKIVPMADRAKAPSPIK